MPKKEPTAHAAKHRTGVLPSVIELLALQFVPGIGRVGARVVLAVAEREACPVGELFGRSMRSLADWFSPSHHRLAQALSESTPSLLRRAQTLLERIEEMGARAAMYSDTAYPESLRATLGNAAPLLLFLRGELSLLETPKAGIVGTRNPSAKGEHLARLCARSFVSEKIPVVSGGARGVDTAAHEETIEIGGATVVVLPQGLLTYTIPPSFVSAAKTRRLLLLSEFAPDAGWATHAAVTRNATISALSRMVCVIEPHSENGSLLTARHALDQGKPIFYTGLSSTHPLKRRAGAESLLDKKGCFDAGRLLAAFHVANAAIPNQQWMC